MKVTNEMRQAGAAALRYSPDRPVDVLGYDGLAERCYLAMRKLEPDQRSLVLPENGGVEGRWMLYTTAAPDGVRHPTLLRLDRVDYVGALIDGDPPQVNQSGCLVGYMGMQLPVLAPHEAVVEAVTRGKCLVDLRHWAKAGGAS